MICPPCGAAEVCVALCSVPSWHPWAHRVLPAPPGTLGNEFHSLSGCWHHGALGWVSCCLFMALKGDRSTAHPLGEAEGGTVGTGQPDLGRDWHKASAEGTVWALL